MSGLLDSMMVSGDVTGRRAVQYPSPYFDLAQSYVPTTVKEMFKWCRFYYFKHPLISPVINKLSEFPITDLVYDSPNEDHKDWWKELLEDIMGFRQFAIGIGLDYYTYGNAFVSINAPVIKRLVCPSCKHTMPIGGIKWKWKKYGFHASCDSCSYTGMMKVSEIRSQNRFDYNFVRWNPSNIDIEYNPLTGKSEYYYLMPGKLIRDIQIGKKSVVETIPQIFIEAVEKERRIKFNNQNFYHFKRETLAEADQEWGKPLVYPVLTTVFYMQVLTRAQEAIAMQHIVPLWVLFPQATTTFDPYSQMNLDNWKRKVEEELLKWKRDPNYIPIMPMPIGFSVIGGEGRGMLLGPEIQMLCQNILAGLGVPQEFIYGGLSYTGTSVTLRMLENHLLGHIRGIHQMLNRFAIPFLAKCLGKDPIKAKMADFKMADDIQRKQIVMQLNASNKLADQTMLAAIDPSYNYQDELVKLNEELADKMNYSKKQNMMNTEIQGLCQIVSASYQAEASAKSNQMNMSEQYRQIKDLQTRAASGDQAAQFQLDQLMGPQNNGAQGQQQAQQGDPSQQQGQAQQGAPDPNMLIQLATMPPDQLQAAVQNGQVDQQSAQTAMQLRQYAEQATPEQMQADIQSGNLDEQTAQVIQAIQQQLQQGQGQGQPMAPNGSAMTEDIPQDQQAAAAQTANPELNSPQMQNMAVMYAKQLLDLPDEARKAVITRMQETSPELYNIVNNAYIELRNRLMAGQAIEKAASKK